MSWFMRNTGVLLTAVFVAGCTGTSESHVKFETEDRALELGYVGKNCFAATRAYWRNDRFSDTSACTIARRYSYVVNGFEAGAAEESTYVIITGPLSRDLSGRPNSILIVRAGGTNRDTTLELVLDATSRKLLSAREVPEGL